MRVRVLWVVREELSAQDSFQQTEPTEGRSERVLGRCGEGLPEEGRQLLSPVPHPIGHQVLASVLMSFHLSSLHLHASPVFSP